VYLPLSSIVGIISLFLNGVNASDKHAWEERFRGHPAGGAFQSGSKTYLLDGVGVGRSRSHLGVRRRVPPPRPSQRLIRPGRVDKVGGLDGAAEPPPKRFPVAQTPRSPQTFLGVAYTHAMRSVADALRDELQDEVLCLPFEERMGPGPAARRAWPGDVPPRERPRPGDRVNRTPNFPPFRTLKIPPSG